MSKKITKAQVIKKRLLSIGLKIALFFLALFFIASVVISIPAVQTRIVNKLSDTIFAKINHEVEIEYINIRCFDTILIRGLMIYDTQSKKMVKADRVILDFKFTDLITQNSINFDKAILQGLNVDMLKNGPAGQFNLNLFIDEIKEKLLRKPQGKKGKDFVMDKIVLANCQFRIYRDDKEPITHRFDQYHFTLQNLDANLQDFLVKPGHISFSVDELQCVDSATGLDVKELETKFVYTRQSMVFQNMDFKTGRSSVSQSMVFNYLQPSSVKEFVDSVKITANVKKSIIHSRDLAHFAPALKKYNEYYKLRGFVEGPINRFNAKNITLEFGRRSELKGYISMYGLPNFEETFINAKINEGKVLIDDIDAYMNEESFDNLKKFGTIRVEGRYSGFPQDFVSNGSFKNKHRRYRHRY